VKPFEHIHRFTETGEGDLSALLRESDRWIVDLARTLQEVGEETVEGMDSSGQVVAKVSGSGRLLKLDIKPRAVRDMDHVAMAEAAMEAIAAARQASAERLADALKELTGPAGTAASAADPLEPYIRAVLREG